MGPEKALCALATTPHPLPAMEGPSYGHLIKGTKLASGNCIRERETLLGNPNSAPMRVCSGKQRFRVSPLAHGLHRNKEGLGFILFRVHWCFAGHR